MQRIQRNERDIKASSDQYNTQLNTYFKQRVLTEEIYNILKEDVKKGNPDAAEQEISYLTDKKYEELYMSQMESLNLTIETP